MHVLSRGAAPAKRQKIVNQRGSLWGLGEFGRNICSEKFRIFKFDGDPFESLRHVLFAEQDTDSGKPKPPPKYCAGHFLVPWLQRRWMACLMAVLIYWSSVPYDTPLFGNAAVRVHFWHSGHRDGDYPFQPLASVITEKRPPFGSVFPKLLGGLLNMLF